MAGGWARQLWRQDHHDFVHAIAAVEWFDASLEHTSATDLDERFRHLPPESVTVPAGGDDRYDVHELRNRSTSFAPANSAKREEVSSRADINRSGLMPRGVKITTRTRAVVVVIIVRAESEVGLPKGPSSSQSTGLAPR